MQQRERAARFVFALGVVLAQGACNQSAKAPPPKPAVAAKPAAAAAPPAPAPPAPSVMHTVSEGETLWDIARSYGVPMKDLMAANGFSTSDIRRLRKGSQVKVPGVDKVVDVETSSDRAAAREALPALTDGAYHFLRHGESLWTLAGLYDKSVESIMERNGFTEDSTSQLREGQPIIIPGVKASQIKEGGKTPKRMGVMHEVVKGETVSDLAHTFGVSVAEIMAANGMTREEVVLIRDGQKIFLPGVEDDGRGHVKREQTPQQRRAEQIAHHLGLGSLTAAGRLLHGLIEERWIRAAGGTSTLPGTLRWPVAQGWFVRGYGSGQGGYHKAMDIMGKLGWNVRAAADGIVGYSGNQVPGFGNLVMVVHPGGWVTLYAHNSVNFVVAGEKVTRGSILAEVGSTGRSLGPHVHFEVIFDGKNCDPAPLFRPGVRHLNGKLAKLQKVMWRMPGKRPAIIQCARRQKHPIQTVEQEDPEKDKIPHADDNATETPPPGDGDEP